MDNLFIMEQMLRTCQSDKPASIEILYSLMLTSILTWKLKLEVEIEKSKSCFWSEIQTIMCRSICKVRGAHMQLCYYTCINIGMDN